MYGNHKVITKSVLLFKSLRCQKNIWISLSGNYKIITFLVMCVNIVITLLCCSRVVWAGTSRQESVLFDVSSPIVQGTLVYGKAEQETQIFYQNKALLLTPTGEFVFAIPKEANTEVILTAQKNNHKISKTYQVISRKWKEEVVHGLPPKKVSPSEDDLKRIASENQILKKARAETIVNHFPSCFIRPVDEKARISSEFGSSRVLNGVKTAGHSGTDYALPTGSPIYAPADGEVKVVHNDMFYSGKTILIDHGYGVFSSYSHLSEILVKQEEKINQGHLIGKIGTTGRSTGPHLHLTITWFGVRVDPEYVLKTYACQN